IMTPRTVVYSLSPDQTAKSINDIEFIHFSRIPLFDKASNTISGIVLRRDIILSLAQGKPNVKLKELASTPIFIPEMLSVYTLLDRLISRKRHLAIVINEYGDYVGIATMEDAIETLLGREIVDETDLVIDMQELARQLLKKRMKIK
ncbi:MAG: CBS domain-containing protein, partial [Fibrobacter sp.]|nr:CBS domain-containing protein [Fibrobacter sp.]